MARILSELRLEREDIEQAILFLERSYRPSSGTTKAAAQSVAEIRRPKEPDDGS